MALSPTARWLLFPLVALELARLGKTWWTKRKPTPVTTAIPAVSR